MLSRLQTISLLLASLCCSTALSSEHSVLFIGNSYTSASAPNSLDESYRQLVLEAQPTWTEVSIEAYSPGGRNLAQHLADAQTTSSTLYTYLSSDEPNHQWDYVVVHDQSQIPGFPQSEPAFSESRDAAVGLAQMIADRGAEMALWVTWGRLDGDDQNQWLYPDYATMQQRLADGYDSYSDAILGAGLSVDVIPVGLGWQMIHDQALAQGRVPQSPDELFARLYTADGSHPSTLGTYLSACIIFAFITNSSPVGLTWSHDGMTAQDKLTLQQTAERLLNAAKNPNGAGDDDSVGNDDDSVGNDDDDSVGNDDDSVGNDDDSVGSDPTSAGAAGEPQSAPSQCGCSLSLHPKRKLWSMALVALLWLRRRRSCSAPQS